jgi:hypothetical protein
MTNGSHDWFFTNFGRIKKTAMHDFLVHLHSGLRWVALILLLVAIVKAFAGMSGNKPFTTGDKKLALYTLISMHLQLVIGLALYIMGKWYQSIDTTDEALKAYHRFFAMEHISGMLLAIILITIGNAKSKRGATDKAKFKSIAVFFTIGLVIILACIPWPFMAKFANLGWF